MWFVDKLGPAPRGRATPPVSGATPYDVMKAQAADAVSRPQPSAATPSRPPATPAKAAASAKAAPPPPEPKKEKKKGWF